MRRLLPLSLLLLASCAHWRPAARYDGWTLFESPDEAIPVGRYEAAFTPAFAAVEERLGTFKRDVRVHAWNGSVRLTDGERKRVRDAEDDGVHDVPGIGPARIQAYHARGGGLGSSGVFIGVPDPGTAAHELVHARFAELRHRLPLWFEEGIACLLGDGALREGRWVVDGLSCWPLRELREMQLTDEDLARLLTLTASDETSVRDNVLVHFVGWAIVFDLYRETGILDWRGWLDELRGDPAGAPEPDLAELRRRLERTLAPETEYSWLQRLSSPDPGVRLAAAKGTWKLRQTGVLDRLLSALEREPDPEVRVALAINALASAGELSLSWRRAQRLEQLVRAAFRSCELPDEKEQRALEDLRRAYRGDGREDTAHRALERLARFWEE